MTRRAVSFATLALALLAIALPATAQAASPAWQLNVQSYPTDVAPSTPSTELHSGPFLEYFAVNAGGASTSGTVTFTDTFPDGLTPNQATSRMGHSGACSIVGQSVTCTETEPIDPGEQVNVQIGFSTGAFADDPTVLANQATFSGGGAPTAQISNQITVSETSTPFGFLPGGGGLGAWLSDADGSAVTQAGSNPQQLSIDIGFPVVHPRPDILVAADGGVRDLSTALPRGLIVNPQSTRILCTAVQLESLECPNASGIGIDGVSSTLDVLTGAVYNMVPPPGDASDFAFNAAGAGIFTHILGGVRAGDYTLQGGGNEILSISNDAIFNFYLQLWGDPSNPSHNSTRGQCGDSSPDDLCPVPPQTQPFITLPTSCADAPQVEATADSWGHPGDFDTRSAPVTDLAGIPSGVTGCNALDFKPTLQARPTTNVADSPSGLSVDLHVPQSTSFNTLATAHLRKAVVTLPPGLAINPSSANGLEGCSSSQIGIDPGTGVANGNPVACPNASRIGEVEVDTPLLDHPTPGSVYIAKPHDNPFDSLLAIYVVIDDPASGTLVKLAGHVEADPQTGQLTTTFDNNPQLPFSEFKLDFFGGAAAPLRTPATCGSYSTTSELTPWSAPDSGPPATSKDTYAISQGPNGGSCATSQSAEPNSPSFDAGTVSPIAGAYSPFVLHLSRNDGSQTFASLTLSPPPGLLAKLAGTPACSDAALRAAEEKSGSQERQSPSCPAASKIGVATVGAGAGPAPYYTQGNAYLAPPYKGAPLSIAIVTPAAAGPYDLGTVVVRSAVHLDPESGQITATSDPIPQILQGIPLDVRSIVLSLDKPQFTLNGTNCDPLSVSGSLLSGIGQSVPLSQRFQLAECGRLSFKPKLSLALKGKTNRGGTPGLTATLTMPPAGANLARASVALPRSEFLDQAHIGTVCTRVQFAADQCPAASVYGSATATSPLLDYALEGPVYLRSSDHELPDLVLALHGPPSQPVEFDAVGRIDSIKGGIRTTFEAVPDAPVSKVVLAMPGGAKGLLENSTNICKKVNRATVLLDGQNGKAADSSPALKVAGCKGKAHKHHRRHKRRR
jgi:hypothetical protein